MVRKSQKAIGVIAARLEAKGNLAEEVRRLAARQAALVGVVNLLVNRLEARLARIEAKVFPSSH